MAKINNQNSDGAGPRFEVSQTQSEENAAYLENWSVKYAVQVAAHNEMVERDGLWSDELRLF